MCIYLHNATPRLGDCFLSCHPFTYILLVEGMIPPLLIYTWTVNWLEVGSMPCMVISTEVCNLVILSSHEKDPIHFFCSRRIGAAFVGSSYVAHICWSFLFQLLMSFTSFDVGGRGVLTHSATSTPFFHPTSVGQRELFWVGTVIQVPSIFVRLK